MIHGKAFAAFFLSLLALAFSHSAMMEPQNTAPHTCRMGGERRFGVDHCRGPCDMRAIRGGYANHGSPSNPAATYRRGQKVTVKYQRNNHGPGGFVRMSLVPADDIMNVKRHNENTFHYTCWGGRPVVAKPNELGSYKGYSLVGNDGEQHHFPKAYYAIDVVIPPVVPDGDYVMRMVWFGGVGDDVRGNSPQRPTPYGYFGDYHSCSFVRISGGAPLASSFQPKFVNDMEQFSNEGCMAANDRPGVCVYEPCRVQGRFQKPFEFKNGKSPKPLTPAHFRSKSPPTPQKPTRSPSKEKWRSCECVKRGAQCTYSDASRSVGGCKTGKRFQQQPVKCKQACCQYCSGRSRQVCRSRNVRQLCGF